MSARVLLPGRATADTVLYDSSGFIEGAQAFTQSFDIKSAGTLTVTLSDVPWLDTVADLNCFLSTSTKVLGPSMGAGTESMQVGPGMVYAHWSGDAAGAYGLGVVGIKVDFTPSVSPVPLPRTAVLLLSGLALLSVWRRRPGETAVGGPSLPHQAITK